MTYHGVRQVDRTVKVATAVGSETAATTTEIYDRQGRLLSVTEPSGSGGANVTTTYGYDVGNRLVSVSTPATVSGSPVTQTRSFSYDRAGLLQSETHPELGAAGNGSTTYPLYDSRGHLLKRIDGLNDLTFVYDPAERLFQVKETGGRGLSSRSPTRAPTPPSPIRARAPPAPTTAKGSSASSPGSTTSRSSGALTRWSCGKR